MSDWKEVAASEFCSSVRDGTHASPKQTECGRKLITSKHITSGRLDLESAYLISDQDFKSINLRSEVGRWDVLISMIGTVGELYLEKEEPEYAIKNMGLFKSKSEQHGKWCYYYLNTPRMKEEIRSQSRGSTQQYIPLSSLRALPIKYPQNENERVSILEILTSLDDKIELNRRMNETLEAQARALFRDWFVDFGPVKAKMANRITANTKQTATGDAGAAIQAPYLSDEIWSLFPSALDDDGKPEGWEWSPISKFCETVSNGGTPKRDERSYWCPLEVPWLTSGEVRQSFIVDTAQWISQQGLEKSSAKWVSPYSTVVALYGATAGEISFLGGHMTTNQAICALKPLKGWEVFNYMALTEGKTQLVNMARGSAQQNLSKGIVEAFRVIEPCAELVHLFAELGLNSFERILANVKENCTLAETRDLLLPKLMSGEIRVAQAEREIEAVL